MLFLLDKYCVGDAFYHELLLAFDGLPRFYLVTHSRDDVNKLCHIDPLQGKYISAKISVQEHIQDYLNQNPSYHINYDKMKVKGNRTSAILSGSKSYQTLQEVFGEIFGDMISSRKVILNDIIILSF